MAGTGEYAVAFAVHDACAGPAAVAATSVLENSPGDFHFYLLDLGISARSSEQLRRVVGPARTTFLTLPEAGELLLGGRERFVYLACDTLAAGDIAPLFDLRLEPFAVGATPRFDDSRCLDPGMLVVDTRAFIEHGCLHTWSSVLRGEWFRLGLEWNFPVSGPLRDSYTGPVPVTYRFSGRPEPFPDMRLMYDEYRRLCVAAGGPS